MSHTIQLDLPGIQQHLQEVFPDVTVLPPTLGHEVLTIHLRQYQSDPADLRGMDVKFSLLQLYSFTRLKSPLPLHQNIEQGVRRALAGGLPPYVKSAYPEFRTF